MASILISVFLAYHLFCVILAPNSMSYLGGRFHWVVAPYVSFFNLASQWGFFAPDPGPPPVFIEFETVGADGETLATGTWPEKGDPFFLRERQNRRIGVARFLMAANERIEKTLGPYYCKAYPAAQSVKLWRVVKGMAALTDVAEGKRTIGDGQGGTRNFVTQFLCIAGRG
ncbi:MAG: hypothetical protein HY075_08045 [Deltaproteobacteria bacterium]|nr:hypothetical protein [Deltaproteobacteria bacterium]